MDNPLGNIKHWTTRRPAPGRAFGATCQFAQSKPPSGKAYSPGGFRRTKLVDLAIQLGRWRVVLVVEFKTQSPEKVQMSLQVCPAKGQSYLPQGLKVAVLEASGNAFREAQAREMDDDIRLQFDGKQGDCFKVQICMDEVGYLEEFIF